MVKIPGCIDLFGLKSVNIQNMCFFYTKVCMDYGNSSSFLVSGPVETTYTQSEDFPKDTTEIYHLVCLGTSD